MSQQLISRNIIRQQKFSETFLKETLPAIGKELNLLLSKRGVGMTVKFTIGDGEPQSWQRALSSWETLSAPVLLEISAGALQEQEVIHFFDLPLVTPRGTFVIEGRERMPLKRLWLRSGEEKTSRHLTEAERTRDLAAYVVVEENFYAIVARRLRAEIKRHGKDLAGYLREPEREGARGRFLAYFNSQYGFKVFPYLDSTNPLSEVQHLCRVSFVRGQKTKTGRDIHPSHYGRLCVVDTPESEKIGTVLHLARHAAIDPATGEITTPIVEITTGTEIDAPASLNEPVMDCLSEQTGKVLARAGDDAGIFDSAEVRYRDRYPDQLFGCGALQVPFIAHNDPARALMGAKNLKQAVPLRHPELPLVRTGYEREVAEASGRILRSEAEGVVTEVKPDSIVVTDAQNHPRVYHLASRVPAVTSKTVFEMNARVHEGDKVSAGQILAEGSAVVDGTMALGANFLVAYMPYFGLNMDDGIVVSERVADIFTSVHAETFDFDVQRYQEVEWACAEGETLTARSPIAVLRQKSAPPDFTADEFATPHAMERFARRLHEAGAAGLPDDSGDILDWLNETLERPDMVRTLTGSDDREMSLSLPFFRITDFDRREGPQLLVRAIRKDWGRRMSFAKDAMEDPLGVLNDLLEDPGLFRLIRHPGAKYSAALRKLIAEPVAEKKWEDLDANHQEALRKLNRLLIEEEYPALCPRSYLDSHLDRLLERAPKLIDGNWWSPTWSAKKAEKLKGKAFEDLESSDKKDRTRANRLLLQRLFPAFCPTVETEKTVIRYAGDEMAGGVVRKVYSDWKGNHTVLRVTVLKKRPLAEGDKIMGRHGNKGVISRIVPVNEMPWFEVERNGVREKRVVDVILNPLGVISRMNVGQILETHFGWVAKEHPDPSEREKAALMGAPFAHIDLDGLSRLLVKSGLDDQGKVTVQIPGHGPTCNPVAVGYQYMVKLNHLAAHKLAVRAHEGPTSYVTGMPVGGRKNRGGQRLGEMEVWALLGLGVDDLARSMLGPRSNAHVGPGRTGETETVQTLAEGAVSISDSLKVFVYYLRGLCIDLQFFTRDGERLEPEAFPRSKRKQLAVYRVSIATEARMKNWGTYRSVPRKASTEDLKTHTWRKREQTEVIPGAQQVTNTNDLFPAYEDQMGYIVLPKPVLFGGMETHTLPVVPVRCRPHPKGRLNRFYTQVLSLAKALGAKEPSDLPPEGTIETLQGVVDKLERELIRHVQGKTGVIRRAILGKRMNYSGRAVIVPDPAIGMGQVRLPERLMKELGVKEGEIVLLNRQPTLHIHNIQAFEAVCGLGDVIGINPLVCGGFNADFDGDAMAVYRLDKQSDAKRGMRALDHILLTGTGRLNLNLSQDIAIGVALSTGTEEGLAAFRSVVGDPHTGRSLPLKALQNVVLRRFLQGGSAEAVKLAEDIERFALREATVHAVTFSIFDLRELAGGKLPQCTQRSLEIITDAESALRDRLLQVSFGERSNPLALMVNSGARGDVAQIRQMALGRGEVERLGNRKTSIPVLSSYLEGLFPTEYYLAAFGARKSLADKKLMTPEGGYLTRKLIFTCFDLDVVEDDCGTKRGVVSPLGKSLGRNIENSAAHPLRNYAGRTIDEDLFEELERLGIYRVSVRSPLACEAETGVCAKCYGWDLRTRKQVSPRFRAGIVAAQAVGERATQDSMRSYHRGEATATIAKFDITRAIFNNDIDPDDKDKRRFSERIENQQDLLRLALRLHEDLYEGKVDLKHYEVLLRPLWGDGRYMGIEEAIERKSLLQRASFERTVAVLRAYARARDEGQDEALKGMVDRLFI